MADERQCYAGDLASFAVGRRIRVVTMTGEPMVDQVSHYRDIAGSPRTLIDFESGATTDVADTEIVQVLP